MAIERKAQPTKVIKPSNLQAQLPFTTTGVAYLLLDKFDAAQWVWGALGVVFVLLWIAAIVKIAKCDSVDLFEEISKMK